MFYNFGNKIFGKINRIFEIIRNIIYDSIGYLRKLSVIRKNEMEQHLEKDMDVIATFSIGKTITLFVHYNINGNIDVSDRTYIKELSEFSDLIFISNSYISKEDKDFVEEYSICSYYRDNVGFDFGAWKDVIIQEENNIKEYDNLILANNSVFAPVNSLNTMFKLMNDKDVDFWGCTAFTEHKWFRSKESRIMNKKKIPQHIQSYFLVFNQTLINDEFFSWWKQYEYAESFTETVANGEIKLTEFFSQKGYKWDVYIEETKFNDKLWTSGPDLTKNEPDMLISLGCPLIKKKSVENLTRYQYEFIKKHCDNWSDSLINYFDNSYYLSKKM